MTDYYPVLSRAVAALPDSSIEARRRVYERARGALVKQLRGYDPPLPESEITRERLALEDTIRKIEGEARRAAPETPPAAAAPPPAAATPPQAQAAPAKPAQESPIKPDADVAAPRSEPEVVRAPVAKSEASPPSPPARAPLPDDADGEEAPARSRLDDQRRPRVSMRPDAPRRKAMSGGKIALAAAVAVVAFVGAAGLGAYLARDQLTQTFGADPAPVLAEVPEAPKVEERVGGDPVAAGANADAPRVVTTSPEPPVETPPAAETPPAEVAAASPQIEDVVPPGLSQPVTDSLPIAQRAMLYEETSDPEGGNAYAGAVVWREEPVSTAPGAGNERQLRGSIDVPDRDMDVTLIIRRNTDETLPASHTIDIQFALPDGNTAQGVANVPGLLFKTAEEEAGTALSGLSVRVMDDFFLIGLSNEESERVENLRLMRERSWIDIPILYGNGRRAVLTLEKGLPGERAFQNALAAWESEGDPSATATTPTVAN